MTTILESAFFDHFDQNQSGTFFKALDLQEFQVKNAATLK